MYKIKLARSKKEGNDRFWQLPTPAFTPKEVDAVKSNPASPSQGIDFAKSLGG